MFIKGKFLEEGAPTSAAIGGGASAAPKSVSEVFDSASQHYFGGDDDEQGDAIDEDTDGSEEFTGEENTEEAPATPEWTSETDAPKPEAEAFKPYVFNGKVFGNEMVQEFKSEEELNKVITKGLAAPQLYKAHQDLKAKLAELEPDAQYGRDLANMAKEDPKGLMELMAEDLIPEEVLAEWVHEKYTHFSTLAKMTPEQRAERARIREAERIIEERNYARQETERLNKARESATAEHEKRQFQAWQGSEVAKWESKIPVEHRESVKTAMRAVVAMAKSSLDAGQKVTFKEMSKQLETILSPITHAKSPAQARREAGKAMEDKKKAATAALQGATKSGGGQAQPQKAPEKMKAEDVFNWAINRVGSGHSKFRS